jgi:hypothetical protein
MIEFFVWETISRVPRVYQADRTIPLVLPYVENVRRR